MISMAQPVFLGKEVDYVADVMASGRLSMGKYVEKLAALAADSMEAAYAVPVSNGTAALHVALLALGVKPGDKVVIPDCSYIATANAVRYCGAHPVFVDIRPDTWTIDGGAAEEAVKTWGAVGIIAVNLFGVPCDVPRIKGVWVLEDACESVGMPMSSESSAAVLSLYGNKIVTCGEGGVVLTNRKDVFERVKLLRGQGTTGRTRYVHEELGFNYRLTDLQAAIAAAQFETLSEHLRRRTMLRRLYDRWLPATLERQARVSCSVDWVMPVLVPNRDVVARVLEGEYSVESRPAFPQLHQQPGYESCMRFPYEDTGFPVSRRLADRGLMLPLHLGMDQAHVKWVCQSLRNATERVA